MPVEQIELSTSEGSFTAELELPKGDSAHGAVLLPGANHTAFDGAVFDRLAAAAADNGIRFLRYQTWDDSEELSDIDIPVAVIQGDEDNFPVANARELAAEIPDASVHVIEGADHSFIGGDPETETIETTLELFSRPVDER